MSINPVKSTITAEHSSFGSNQNVVNHILKVTWYFKLRWKICVNYIVTLGICEWIIESSIQTDLNNNNNDSFKLMIKKKIDFSMEEN